MAKMAMEAGSLQQGNKCQQQHRHAGGEAAGPDDQVLALARVLHGTRAREKGQCAQQVANGRDPADLLIGRPIGQREERDIGQVKRLTGGGKYAVQPEEAQIGQGGRGNRLGGMVGERRVQRSLDVLPIPALRAQLVKGANTTLWQVVYLASRRRLALCRRRGSLFWQLHCAVSIQQKVTVATSAAVTQRNFSFNQRPEDDIVPAVSRPFAPCPWRCGEDPS